MNRSSALAAVACIVPTNALAAAPFTILHRFDNSGDRSPFAGVTALDTKLYGAALMGGTGGHGALFSLNLDGSNFTILHGFQDSADDGAYPMTNLSVIGSHLVGTSFYGGHYYSGESSGTIFSLNPNGTEYTKRFFFGDRNDPNQTAWPRAGVIESGGKFYGTTGGSTNSPPAPPKPAVYSVNTDGSDFKVLANFVSGWTVDWSPQSKPLLVGSRLYVTLTNGPLYALNTDGSDLRQLWQWYPGFNGGLTYLDGKIFGGAKPADVATQGGTLFSMNPDGSGRTVLHTFPNNTSDGAIPSGDLIDVDDMLFGITDDGGAFGGGIVFSIHPDGSGYKIWHEFSRDDGFNPRGPMALIGNTLFGTTFNFETNTTGTIWALQIPEPSGLILLLTAPLLLTRAKRSGQRPKALPC